MPKKLRFAILGCGFWAGYQLPAWLETEGVTPVALYNRTLDRALALGKQYHIEHCYDDAEKLFENEALDFADIITDVDTHVSVLLRWQRIMAYRSFAINPWRLPYPLPAIC